MFCWAIALVTVDAARATPAEITLADFPSPRIFDFESMRAGSVTGTESAFVNFALSSVSPLTRGQPRIIEPETPTETLGENNGLYDMFLESSFAIDELVLDTPEAGSFWLMSLGLLGVWLSQRRPRRTIKG